MLRGFYLFFMVFAAYIGTGQVMGWGNKAIEIRNVETGHLDGVFMHKKAQKLKFLCERNDKVSFSSFKTSILQSYDRLKQNV